MRRSGLAALPEVLFDVDGVLVHPWRFRDHLVREYGIGPAETQAFFRGPFTRCVVGDADLHEELAPFLELWGWRDSVESFVEEWLLQENAPNEPVLEFVDRIRSRGVRCHVASTQERNRAAYLRDTMGFGRRFDSVIFSCELGAAKPDRRFFARAQQGVGRPASELILVDDSLANVAAAREAGWQAVHYIAPESLDGLWRMIGLPITRFDP